MPEICFEGFFFHSETQPSACGRPFFPLSIFNRIGLRLSWVNNIIRFSLGVLLEVIHLTDCALGLNQTFGLPSLLGYLLELWCHVFIFSSVFAEGLRDSRRGRCGSGWLLRLDRLSIILWLVDITNIILNTLRLLHSNISFLVDLLKLMLKFFQLLLKPFLRFTSPNIHINQHKNKHSNNGDINKMWSLFLLLVVSILISTW